MKKLSIIIAALTLTACATPQTPPLWQQDLERIGRNWREPAPLVYPDYRADPATIRAQINGINDSLCRF